MTRQATSWLGDTAVPGERTNSTLAVSKSYAGTEVHLPVQIWKGTDDGPTLVVTAAVHGDEINGTGAIRALITDPTFTLQRGTLVLMPVVNIMGFERNSRYLPDRRDLNRCFPGSPKGSLAARLAYAIFDGVIRHCDYCIDLHTAAARRTNFPNVRADMSIPAVADFARAFGTELIVAGRGPKGSLRRAATNAGCPTLILEAGEVWKVESTVVAYAIRGIANCLAYLGMTDGKVEPPPYRIETDATSWVRAELGGFLEFHVSPGQIVEKGDPIASNTELTGTHQNLILAPRSGVVLGMTTLPSVAPGDPICHLAYPKDGELKRAAATVDGLANTTLHEQTREHLSRSIIVSDPGEQSEK